MYSSLLCCKGKRLVWRRQLSAIASWCRQVLKSQNVLTVTWWVRWAAWIKGQVSFNSLPECAASFLPSCCPSHGVLPTTHITQTLQKDPRNLTQIFFLTAFLSFPVLAVIHNCACVAQKIHQVQFTSRWWLVCERQMLSLIQSACLPSSFVICCIMLHSIACQGIQAQHSGQVSAKITGACQVLCSL